MGGPTSSYAASGIALEFIGAHKPLIQQQSAFDKVEIPSKQHYGYIYICRVNIMREHVFSPLCFIIFFHTHNFEKVFYY
jgi:hypothetical protein